MASKIRVGMVGITPNRGFSSIAHMPALQALPDFEIPVRVSRAGPAVGARRRAAGHQIARHGDCVRLMFSPLTSC